MSRKSRSGPRIGVVRLGTLTTTAERNKRSGAWAAETLSASQIAPSGHKVLKLANLTVRGGAGVSRLSVPSRSLAPGNVVDRTEECTLYALSLIFCPLYTHRTSAHCQVFPACDSGTGLPVLVGHLSIEAFSQSIISRSSSYSGLDIVGVVWAICLTIEEFTTSPCVRQKKPTGAYCRLKDGSPPYLLFVHNHQSTANDSECIQH